MAQREPEGLRWYQMLGVAIAGVGVVLVAGLVLKVGLEVVTWLACQWCMWW